MKEKILVSDKLSEDGLKVFEEAGFEVDHLPEITPEEIRDCIGEYSAWVIRSRSRATADIIENAAKLRVIGRAGVGVDNVDSAAATRKGIIVMNTPGGNTTSTAEHTVSMMVSLARKIPQAHASMAAGKWDKKAFMGVEMNGKVLGVIGLGRIGQEVVQRMKAFKMRVLGYDPFVSSERMRQLGIDEASVDEICEKSDFITVHTPLSPETKDLLNKDAFAKMKSNARIVNCARGGIVNEDDLVDALKSGQIAGAALDVFSVEPIASDHPLRSLDNVVLSPHIAASTTEAQENVAIQVAEQIVDVLKSGLVRNALNAPSLDPDVLQKIGPHMDLAEKLGRFMSQYHRERAVRIDCRYSGSILDHPLEPLTTAIVKGFVEDSVDGPVNFVNAHQILKDRGIELLETRRSELFQYTNLMTVMVTYESGARHHIGGTLFGPRHPRIVILDEKHFDAVPEGNLLVIENRDVPGIIGSVGTAFGRQKVNIAQMTWGRREGEDVAMTIINVDSDVTDDLLKEVQSVENVISVVGIKL